MAAGYTEFGYSLPLSVKAPAHTQPKDVQQSTDFSNQSLNAKISGWNIETILSKKLSFFTPFLSVGYNSSKLKIGLNGNYPMTSGLSVDLQHPTITKQYTTFANPVNINRSDLSGMHANIGFQLKLLILRIYASYRIAEYNLLNAGIGIGF